MKLQEMKNNPVKSAELIESIDDLTAQLTDELINIFEELQSLQGNLKRTLLSKMIREIVQESLLSGFVHCGVLCEPEYAHFIDQIYFEMHFQKHIKKEIT